MADALLNTSDLQRPNERGHSACDEDSEDDDSTDGSIRFRDRLLSDQLERRRATCRYFDNHPRTIHNKRVLDNDYFYQEHLKSCHFSPCEPLPAPHDNILPEEPPLCAEVPFCLMTSHLRPVKLRDKLLSSRHIRLVRLPPDQFSESQHDNLPSQSRCLLCNVYQVSLDDILCDGQPMFAALSYACGNPALTHYVRCGEDYVPTTQNLFEALTYVRHEDFSRLVWADGLCINQEDIGERNHQVGLLNEIYSRAHVITWLGTGDQTDLTALSTYLSSTARAWTSVVRSAEAASLGRRWDGFRIAAAARCRERTGKRASLPDVDHIVNADYFTRVWVAQEIFLGKSVVCQLGNLFFSVASHVASMELWEYHYGRYWHDIDDINYHYLMPSLQGTWHGLQDSSVPTMQDLSIVRGFRGRQCSDPRDHIYGLSALFKSPTAYPIDYSLSVAEIFCDFTVHSLRSFNDLSILYLCRSMSGRIDATRREESSPAYDRHAYHKVENDFGLPSWCPSWVESSEEVARMLFTCGLPNRWHASGERGLSLGRTLPLTITLDGCAVSRIPWCSADTVDHDYSSATLIASAIQDILFRPQHPLPSSGGQKHELAQLLSSVIDSIVYQPDSLHGLIESECETELTHSTRTLLESCEPAYRLRELLFPVYLASKVPDLYSLAELQIDTRIPTDDYETITHMVENTISNSCYGCRLFITDDGMLGTGFSGMMAGDVVCILFGGNVPYILRPTDIEGQYILIGECYVKGLMQGEALEMGLREQRFTLV
jgi:hypothetical protein